MSFTKLGLPQTLVTALAEHKYTTAYHIQAADITAILDRKIYWELPKQDLEKQPVLSSLFYPIYK